MEKEKIRLGDKVEDIVTGYSGIATARCEFLNGCIQYTVARKIKPNQDYPTLGDPSVDETSLKVIKKRVIDSKEYQREDDIKKDLEEYKKSLPKKIKIKDNGGPVRFMGRMKGY